MRWTARSSSGISDDISWIGEVAEEPLRLKKVQGKKKRDAAEAEAKRQLEMAERQDDVSEPLRIEEIPNEVEASVDLLNSKDEDVIF
jgi:V-type H+-transporting ATPase subunit D